MSIHRFPVYVGDDLQYLGIWLSGAQIDRVINIYTGDQFIKSVI